MASSLMGIFSDCEGVSEGERLGDFPRPRCGLALSGRDHKVRWLANGPSYVRASRVPDDFADLDAVDGDRVACRRVRLDPFRRRLRGLFGFEDDHPCAVALVEADPVPADEAWRLAYAWDALLIQELPCFF
jgi:hypothetical protein